MRLTAPVRPRSGCRLLSRSVASVALLAGLAGCGASGSDPVKEQWTSRDPLPSCGTLHLRQGQQLEVDGQREVACLQRAMDSGRGAELAVRYPTVEGDPVTDHYRVTPEGRTEVYTDSTQDTFSNQTWSFASCDHPRTVLEVNC